MATETIMFSGGKGNKAFCCPECKKQLKVSLDLHGDDEEDQESIDYIDVSDVQQRIWFKEILVDEDAQEGLGE